MRAPRWMRRGPSHGALVRPKTWWERLLWVFGVRVWVMSRAQAARVLLRYRR